MKPNETEIPVASETADESNALIPAPAKTDANALSRRSFLTQSGYTVAALLALSQWDGLGVSPAEARGISGANSVGGAGLSATPPPRLSLPFWSDAANWNDTSYWTTMQSGRRQAARTYRWCDFDGDGREELMIRGPGGIQIMQWNAANAQWMPLPGDTTALQDFNDNDFGQQQYYYTLQVGNIFDDGRPEIVGRFSDGLRVYFYDNLKHIWVKWTTCDRFSDSAGWGTAEYYYQTIQCGDVDGDGYDEVVARAGGGIIVWKYNGSTNTWSQIAESDRFPDSGSWTYPWYWSTIQLADVDGDHAKELIARSGNGLEVWKYNGVGGFDYKGILEAWSDANNWGQAPQYPTIQCADVDGDGVEEIFGNGIAGLEIFKFDITTGQFTLMAARMADTASGYGWDSQSNYFSLQFADIDGDGAKEIIARAGSAGILAFKLEAIPDGTYTHKWVRFAESDVNKELSDANGWNEVKYFTTFQGAHVLRPGDADYTGDGKHTQAIVLGRGPLCVLNYGWSAATQSWRFMERSAPDFSGDSAKQAAYMAIAPALFFNAPLGIRSKYNDLTFDIAFQSLRMYSPPPGSYELTPRPNTILPLPSGIDPAAWQEVVWQIYWEMQWVKAVRDWYLGGDEIPDVADLIKTVFGQQANVLNTVNNYLSVSGGTNLAVDILSILANGAWAILGIPALDSGTASAIAGIMATALSGVSLAPSGDTYAGTFSNLQDAITNGFTQAIHTNTSNVSAIIGGIDPGSGILLPANYSLLKSYGESIVSGTWSWPVQDLDTPAERAYAIGCWQALLGVQAFVDVEYENQYRPYNYYYRDQQSWGFLWKKP